MATYNNRTIVAMPTTGPSPKSIDYIYGSAVGVSENPFNLTKQIQDWQAHRSAMAVTLPPMHETDANNWTGFLISLSGQANVFQITDSFWLPRIPPAANVTGYWALAKNEVKWSVQEGIVYGFFFEIEEVK